MQCIKITNCFRNVLRAIYIDQTACFVICMWPSILQVQLKTYHDVNYKFLRNILMFLCEIFHYIIRKICLLQIL